MSVYRVDVKSTFGSQQFLNTLWYRDTGFFLPGANDVDLSRELGEKVRDRIIAGALGQTRWSDVVANGVHFASIEIMPYDVVTWQPTLTAPVSVHVGINSTFLAGYAFSPESTYIVVLKCGAHTWNPLDYTPQGGYLAVGPAQENSTNQEGRLEPQFITSLQAFGNRLKETLDGGIFSDYKPVRVGRGKNALGVRVRGYADIETVYVNPRVSFRRSRRPR